MRTGKITHLSAVCLAVLILTSLTLPALAFEETTGTVTASALNFRAAPSTGADVITVLRRGAEIQLLGREGDWYIARHNGVEGFVSSAFVTRSLPAAEPVALSLPLDEDNSADCADAESAYPMHGVITGSVVNLRAGPSTATAALTQLRRGSSVVVHGSSGIWVQVSTAIHSGWVHSSYIYYAPVLAANADNMDTRAELVARALSYLGVRYILGGASPNGFDCSGFTQYIYRQFGHAIHRTASTQLNNGTAIPRSELLPGDMVFFRDPSRGNFAATHVGIYIGGNQFIHATRPGGSIDIDTMDTGYYNRYFSAARRIIP
jgi:cell wall-associated NlpC family hydrolase